MGQTSVQRQSDFTNNSNVFKNNWPNHSHSTQVVYVTPLYDDAMQQNFIYKDIVYLENVQKN